MAGSELPCYQTPGPHTVKHTHSHILTQRHRRPHTRCQPGVEHRDTEAGTRPEQGIKGAMDPAGMRAGRLAGSQAGPGRPEGWLVSYRNSSNSCLCSGNFTNVWAGWSDWPVTETAGFLCWGKVQENVGPPRRQSRAEGGRYQPDRPQPPAPAPQ